MMYGQETAKQRLTSRVGMLKQERASWLPHYRDLSDFFLPRRGRHLSDSGQPNRGDRRNGKLVDPQPRLAARTLSSGMVAGLTSPARPWFRLSTPDPDLAEFASVKRWLDIVSQRMRDVFARSNLYNALPTLYLELGVFGTAPILVDEHSDDIIRCFPFTVGAYSIGLNSDLSADTFAREYKMTVKQVVGTFGLNNVSMAVRALWDSCQYDQWVDVCHMIAPNEEFNHKQADHRGMPYSSVYWEAGGDEDRLLRIKGYHEFPIMAPRWDVTGEDIYGSSPGMDALGLSKALQLQTKRKAQAIDKHVDPPMNAPTSMRNSTASLLPGAVNFNDSTQGQRGFEPVYTIKPEINALLEDIQDMRQLISRCMYEDLFLMLAMSDRRQITAREIEERHEEKLLMLGPVLERLNDELLDPLIDRVFAIMLRRGLLPEPPRELQGVDLKVEYISILAQAQRSVATAGLERLAGFVGSIAQVKPDITDKVDFDQMIDEYSDALGVPARVIVSDDNVALARDQRQQMQRAQAMAMAAQPAQQGAAAVKSLSDAKMAGGDESALDRIVGMMGGGAA